MDISELGRVHAYLLRYRLAETKSERRHISNQEKEVATLLREASEEVRQMLNDLLAGQGLMLKEFDEFTAGVPKGATVFVLARDPGAAESAPFWGLRRLTDGMNAGTQQAGKVWFVLIWFVMLDLLYTRRQRSPKEMERYVETSFTIDILIAAVQEHVEKQVRRLTAQEVTDDAVLKIIAAEKGQDIKRFCANFIELMLEANLLERRGDDSYRQSLLAAFEMKQNFDRDLALLLPAVEPAVAASELLVKRPEETEDEE